jgi:hypothetical protein
LQRVALTLLFLKLAKTACVFANKSHFVELLDIYLLILFFSVSAASVGLLCISARTCFAGTTASLTWSFTQLQASVANVFVGFLASASVSIDAAQCSPERQITLNNFLQPWNCETSPSSVCLPPGPWGAFTATKGAHFSIHGQWPISAI